MTRRYTGPAKPIRTYHVHPVDHRATRAIFLLALIGVLLLDLFYWRP